MLYEMLTARRPFRRETAAETLSAILRDDPPIVPGTPRALDRIARRCLANSPEVRFASARDLASALDSATQVPPSRRRAAGVAVAVVAGAVVVSLVLLVWKEGGVRGFGGSPTASHPAELTSIGEAPSPVVGANECFERGLLFLRAQFDIARAREMLDRAVVLDPSFGSARAMRSLTDAIAIHVGIANDAGSLYDVEREMREILATQPDLASAHAVLGAAMPHLNRSEQARQELMTAERLNPQIQPGAVWEILLDRYHGRLEAAELRARRILEPIPLFWAARIILSDILFDEGRIDEASREIEKVFEQDPANLGAALAMARVQIYEGQVQRARETLEATSAATNPNYRVRLVRALLLAREGDGVGAAAVLDAETPKYANIALFAPAEVAEVDAIAGHTEDALEWLDRAVRHGDERSAWFRRDALLANVQSQPSFRLIRESIDRGKP